MPHKKKIVEGFCYPDDLTILFPTVRELQKWLVFVKDFANDYAVTLNTSKTLCMCLGRMSECPPPQIYLNGKILE